MTDNINIDTKTKKNTEVNRADDIIQALINSNRIDFNEFTSKFGNMMSTKSKFYTKEKKEKKEKIVNKGTGAGGSKTTKNGLPFELTASYKGLNGLQEVRIGTKYKGKTHTMQLLELKTKTKYKEIAKTQQDGFNKLMVEKNIPSEKELYRNPDSAYICTKHDETVVIKIIECKTQNVSGSVIDKLFNCSDIQDYYTSRFKNCIIEVCYCITKFFETDIHRFKDITEKFKKHDIKYFFVEDEKYQEKLENFIYS